MKLVPDAKRVHRTYSFNAMALSTAILSTWAALPDKMQDALPIGWVIGTASVVLVLGIVGRYIDQTKVKE